MKVQIKAASNCDSDKQVIIEVDTIDEAINRIQTDINLFLSIINKYSWLYEIDYDTCIVPNTFIINTYKTKDYDISITLYDDYIE